MRCELAVNSVGYVYPNRKTVAFKGGRILPEIARDTVNIVRKSPVAEFKNYVANWRKFGENFEPISENPQSVFMEYFNYRKQQTMPKPQILCNGLKILPKSGGAKIMTSESELESLIKFKDFIQTKSELAKPEDYGAVVDEIALQMPEYVQKYHRSIRPEISERSGDIYRWRSYLELSAGDEETLPSRFYDEAKKEQALREYTAFVEGLTGKKVLIGTPDKMKIGVDSLGLLNDPNSYRDVDFILFGHGEGSSLITNTNAPETWRFKDSGKSVWEFIEENVPKGKKVLATVCEKDRYYREDGSLTHERKADKRMYDKAGHYMAGIGNVVATFFGHEQPAKLCESGVRHIIGHTQISRYRGFPTSFISGAYGDVSTMYYAL